MQILKFKMFSISNMLCLLVALLVSDNLVSSNTDSIVKTKIYHINYPVVGTIVAVGLISDYIAISRIKGKTAISDQELLFLNTQAQKDLINPIDRWALRQKASDRKQYQHISDYSMAPLILLPSLLLVDKKIRKDWGKLLLIYAEGHITTFTFYNYSPLGPTFQNRYRPMTYYSEFSDEDRKNGNNRNSFYSGHVASIAYSTFFMTKVYCDYHPEMGNAKYLLYIAAAIPPALMGYARIKALDHFPSDAAVGLALGAVIGIVIPQLHKYPCKKDLSLGMFSSPYGSGLSVTWKLPAQHLLTLSK